MGLKIELIRITMVETKGLKKLTKVDVSDESPLVVGSSALRLKIYSLCSPVIDLREMAACNGRIYYAARRSLQIFFVIKPYFSEVEACISEN